MDRRTIIKIYFVRVPNTPHLFSSGNENVQLDQVEPPVGVLTLKRVHCIV